jgi:RHS repeat-associated protein
VRAQETIEYYGVDVTGSVRVVFDASGVVAARHDYEPFGTPVTPVGTDPKIFAHLFHDEESQLEFAQARQFQARTGRFTAVDAVHAGLFDPQRWNRYAYAKNTPLTFVDPSGLNACADPCFRSGVTGHYPDDSFWIQMQLWWLGLDGSGGGGGGTFYSEPGGSGGGGYTPGTSGDGTATIRARRRPSLGPIPIRQDRVPTRIRPDRIRPDLIRRRRRSQQRPVFGQGSRRTFPITCTSSLPSGHW